MTQSQNCSDSLKVFLHDYLIELCIGVHEGEDLKPQPVLINIEIETDPGLCHFNDATEKSLEAVIDYESVYDFILHDIPRQGPIGLLETLAEKIISFCFRDVRVESVRVRLEKTKVFSGARGAGIELYRKNPSSKT